MVKIEFPADRTDIALAVGQALVAIGKGEALVNSPAATTAAAQEVKEEAAPDPKPEAASSATDSSESGGQSAGGASVAKASGQTHDEHGVPFNPEFCGDAAKPFYASGADKGKWKKRQGVDKAAYDAWHAEELAKLGSTAAADVGGQDESYDTSNAFGGQSEGTPADANAPKNGGELFVWVSEQTAAGNLDQAKVTGAYANLGLTVADVMPGSPNEAENVAKVHSFLAQMAAA